MSPCPALLVLEGAGNAFICLALPLHAQEGANPVESAECVMAFAKDMLRTSKEVGRAEQEEEHMGLGAW